MHAWPVEERVGPAPGAVDELVARRRSRRDATSGCSEPAAHGADHLPHAEPPQRPHVGPVVAPGAAGTGGRGRGGGGRPPRRPPTCRWSPGRRRPVRRLDRDLLDVVEEGVEARTRRRRRLGGAAQATRARVGWLRSRASTLDASSTSSPRTLLPASTSRSLDELVRAARARTSDGLLGLRRTCSDFEDCACDADAAVGLVEAAALEGDADVAEDLAQLAAQPGTRSGGRR